MNDGGTVTSDQAMFSATASEIEKADPVGSYPLYGLGGIPSGLASFSGADETRNVRPGDLTLAQLEDPGVDGLVPNSRGQDQADSESAGLLTGADARNNMAGFVELPMYDPNSQFNSNTVQFWDGDDTVANPDHPAVTNFLGSYGGFTGAFFAAHSAMSDELHETAANIRKMAAVYKATEDQTKRDVFGVHLPAPYNP